MEGNNYYLTKEELEKRLVFLESKKEEIEWKINNCKIETTLNVLLTAYTALCGFIVDIKSAIIAGALVGFGALVEQSNVDRRNHQYLIEQFVNTDRIESTKQVLNLRNK